MTEGREYLGVDLPAKDHFCQLERVVVGHPSTFDNRLHDTELFCELGQLLAAAVNDADPNADLVEQRELFGEGHQIFAVFGDLAGKFDDKGLSLKTLDVGKRFAKQVEVFDVHFMSSVIIAFCMCRRFSASWITTELGESMTLSVTITFLRTGRQCINIAS